MSLIFDGFKTKRDAINFAEKQSITHGIGFQVFDTVEEAQEADPFPYELTAPIVHLDRETKDGVELDTATERQIAEVVGRFGGVFAGT